MIIHVLMRKLQERAKKEGSSIMVDDSGKIVAVIEWAFWICLAGFAIWVVLVRTGVITSAV